MPQSEAKLRYSLLVDNMGKRGDAPQEFAAKGFQLGVLKRLGEEGFAEEVKKGTWRLTRNGHLEGLRLVGETFQKGTGDRLVKLYKGERR